MAPVPPMLGTALIGLDRPAGPVVIVETWDGVGRTGLAALPAPAGLEPTIAAARRILAPEGPEPDSASWLERSPEWAAWGAVQTARADLAARAAGVPLWLWLGGSAGASARASWTIAHPETQRAGPAPDRGWDRLKDAILERTIDLLEVAPIAVGGPPGVARLDAIARAWQLELAIEAETSLVLSRALAVHLAATALTARSPALPNVDAVSWLRAVEPASRAGLPSAPGLGVILDRGALPAGTARVVVA